MSVYPKIDASKKDIMGHVYETNGTGLFTVSKCRYEALSEEEKEWWHSVVKKYPDAYPFMPQGYPFKKIDFQRFMEQTDHLWIQYGRMDRVRQPMIRMFHELVYMQPIYDKLVEQNRVTFFVEVVQHEMNVLMPARKKLSLGLQLARIGLQEGGACVLAESEFWMNKVPKKWSRKLPRKSRAVAKISHNTVRIRSF